jgi:hypothetical protein
VSVSPTTAYADTTLTATPSGWSDADGDSPGYRYQWKKNGSDISGATASTLTGANLSGGDVVTCQVTPWDGTDTGTPKVSNAVTILDDPRTLTLGAGWTLVGISRTPINPSASSIFGAAAVGTVWGWDGTKYVPATTVEPLHAYWVPTTAPASVQYDCLPLSESTPDFSNSWNMFAVADETPLPLDDPRIVGSVWGWDGTKYVRALSSVQPDKGYWVATETAGKSVPTGYLPKTGSGKTVPTGYLSETGADILDLTLNLELSGVDRGWLEIGLLDAGGWEIRDPAPPASPDGFTCYILGSEPFPFNCLWKELSVLAADAERFSWLIVAQVPAGNNFSMSWDGSSLPQNVVLTITELDVADASPKGGSLSMRDMDSVSRSSTVSWGFAWKVEATVRPRAAEDADGDLIADDWEEQNFVGGACDPNSDEDGDGMTNRQEFLAGTNPNDASSALAISVIQKNGAEGGILLAWDSVPGRKYQVLYCDSLGKEWSCLGTAIEGTGDTLTLQSLIPISGVPQRFYRLEVW